ncbi:squalene/phytoene synthase family protein [Roseomonas sp. OT10]|uniref:squalene/phytoene synthase family protein n=1 Tax=Roseomonas cutis TaxID=2897332 RepID=UPI001E3454FE|nr:squalene/phytoene synthase family protein [Roseomonas sp. OT10]UFN50361.1 squalene/phytoene synthase family protein [Roseomonas sp. OT10]
MPELSPIGTLARRGDPDRFLCALFAPPDRRESLFALIAFDRELARARAVASQPTIALIRLQWWRDAVEAAAAGRPARRHEVAEPLHAAITAGQLDPADLGAMIDAREAEVEEESPSPAAFAAWLRGTAGGFAVASGRLLGAPPGTLVGLQAWGAASGLARLLGGLAVLAGEEGVSPLPVELLDGARSADPRDPAVREATKRLAAEALASLNSARPVLRALPRQAVAAALPGVLARRDLHRIARDGAPPHPPAARGAGDRWAVTLAGLRGRV